MAMPRAIRITEHILSRLNSSGMGRGDACLLTGGDAEPRSITNICDGGVSSGGFWLWPLSAQAWT